MAHPSGAHRKGRRDEHRLRVVCVSLLSRHLSLLTSICAFSNGGSFARGHRSVISANGRIGRPLLRTSGGALAWWSRRVQPPDRALAGAHAHGERAGSLRRRSRSTSSTDRSAASPASRCSVRSAACCRRTGSSARCRRSAATSCRGGYASFGFIVEPGHELPIGVSRRRRIGIDHVGLNCAVCHTGTVRDTPDVAAADRAGHAGAPARPAGVRASSCSSARSTAG